MIRTFFVFLVNFHFDGVIVFEIIVFLCGQPTSKYLFIILRWVVGGEGLRERLCTSIQSIRLILSCPHQAEDMYFDLFCCL